MALWAAPGAAQDNNGIPQNDTEPPEKLFGMELEELMNVEVYAPSKKLERLQHAPATVIVVTRQQIDERGYETLEDALRDLPGFDFVRVHGTWPTIWAQRGLYGDENKRTLLLIDGIVENNLLEGSVLGGPQYTLHDVERIEVIYGPASALFGANAFAGVINVVTRKGEDTQGLEFQTGAGSFRTRFNKLSIGGASDGVDIFLSGSLYDSNGPVFDERHPRYTNSYVDNAYSILGRLRYHGLTLGFNRFDRPMGEGQFSNRPGYYGLPGYGWEGQEGEAGGIAQTDVSGERPSLWHTYTQTAFLKGELQLGEGIELFAQLFHRKTGIAADSYEYDYPGSGTDFSRDPYTHDSSSLGSELRLSFALDHHQDLLVGSQYEWSDIERGYRGTRPVLDAAGGTHVLPLGEGDRVSDKYSNEAAYAQYVLRADLLRKTHLTVGARIDNSNRYGRSFNPRAGVVVSPHERLTLKALVGTAYRAPNSFEMYTATNVRKANPDLLPERERTVEVSAALTVNPDLLLELSAFHNDFTDIIVSNVDTAEQIPGTGETYKQNRNVGSARVNGLELKATAFPGDTLDFFGNLSLLDATQTDAEATYPAPNVASVKGNVGATLRLPKLLTLYVVGNWVGPRTTASTNPDDDIPGYFVTNLALSTHDFPYERFGVTVTVNNLFDVRYEDPGIRSANAGYYGTRHVQPGRNAFVKLTLAL